MSIRGLFVGVLILTGLEVVLSRREAAGRVGGLLESIGRGVGYFLDPTLPAIPDLAGVGTSSSSGGSSLGDTLKGLAKPGVHLKPLPDIPGVPQGPITGIPYSPIADTAPRHATPTTVEV